MIDFFSDWYRRNFTDPQAVLLMVFLAVSFAIVIFLGDMLAPLLAALVIAYLLESPVLRLEKRDVQRLWAVIIVFSIFMAIMSFLVLGLLPVLSRQLSEFFQDLPRMITDGQKLLLRLPEQYPDIIKEEQVFELIGGIRSELASLGQNVLSVSLASIPLVITVLVYVILGPILIFFFLKDKLPIISWFKTFLPNKYSLLQQVWSEMDEQMGNYIRGKVYEIFIVGSVSYATFSLMGLAYAPLLGVLVGFSVIIPYIGATIVTLPIALVGYFQWNLTSDFGWLMFAYLLIQALDGNLLVPLLFSEAVNLHPVAIITAVLFFGGLWGFWGVFFAIPLATLVKAILKAWPSQLKTE